MNVIGTEVSNSSAVTCQLLKKLKVNANHGSVSNMLKAHPKYPRLLAISDCLTDLKVNNSTYLIDEADYKYLKFPFISYLASIYGFALIHEISNGQVKISNENGITFMAEKEFFKIWNQTALFAESNQDSGEQNYRQNRLLFFMKSLVFPMFVVVAMTVLYHFFFFWPFNAFILGLGLLKLAGMILSFFLLMHLINSKDPFIKKLCGLAGGSECDPILKSKAANITSWLSWSEVGFFYFAGSFLIILFYPVFIPTLKLFNYFALPYTIFSFFYQYRHKSWCLLCCGVQVLLVMESIVFYHFKGSAGRNLVIGFVSFIPLIVCLLIPVLLWALQKEVLMKASLSKALQQKLKFKYNSEMFNLILTRQKYYEVRDELMPVTLGNPAAETIITIVSNPFCGPCWETHRVLEQWLNQRKDFQVKLIFINDNTPQSIVSRHIMALSLLTKHDTLLKALNSWYDYKKKKRYDVWAEKYPVNIPEAVLIASEAQKKWCSNAEISVTPTILVNGFKLPEPYRLEDLKYLIY